MKLFYGLFIIIISLYSCTPKELDKTNTTVNSAQIYNLVEERQRVIRYSCTQEVISDKTETVKAPVQYLSIEPKDKTNLVWSNFNNKTLGKSANAVTGYTKFTIDYNPGFLNMEVKDGINEIEYSFYYCDSYINNGETKKCATDLTLKESGSIFINVTYEKINLDGKTEIYPDPTTCK